jgi:phenol hydroxylase P4 protein
MAINTINGEYPEIIQDAIENFHGNQLVIVDWENHRGLGGTPNLFPLPPDMPFKALISDVLSGVFGLHADWEKIDWSAVEWTIDGEVVTPNLDASLKENGVGHKSFIWLKTPSLLGYKGTLN